MSINPQIIPDWTKTDDEIMEWLNEPIRVKTGLKIRFNDIEEQFPDTSYRSLVISSVAEAAKVDPEAQVVFIAASSEGADLSDKSAQAKTRSIAEKAEWPEELTSWVLTRCVHEGPRWTHLGISSPTLEDIADARRINTTLVEAANKFREIVALRQKWDNLHASIRSMIDAGTLSSDQVPSKVSEVWQR